MKHSAMGLMTAFMLIGFLSACAFIIVPYSPPGSSWPQQIIYDRTFPLTSGGQVELSLEGLEAEVEIAGGVKEEVRITASQSGPFYRRGIVIAGSRRDSPRFEVEPSESRLKVKVAAKKETIFPVRLELRVPRQVELRPIYLEKGNIFIRDLFGLVAVNLGRGNLKVSNFSGSLSAMLDKGQIEAEVLDLREEDEINLMSGEGNISLLLEPQVSACLEAEAPEGRISSDFPLDQSQSNQVTATLGEGKAKIVLTALKGNIELKKNE